MSNGCFVLSTSGLFSLKVVASKRHIMTHADVIAHSCDWQISEATTSADIWKNHMAIYFYVLNSVV